MDCSGLVNGYERLLGIDVSRFFVRLAKVHEMVCCRCGLIFFWPQAIGDERFYAELATRPWYYMHDKREFDIAGRYVSSGMRVLEVGAGQGAFSRHVAAAEYIGLDFSPSAAAAAQSRGVRVLQERIEAHSEANRERYDVACAFQVLEHVAAPLEFLNAMAACVKPGGRVIVSVPSEDGFAGRAINDFLNLPPHHVTRWTDSALGALAVNTGMVLEALEHETLASYHHAWFLSVRLVARLGLAARPGARIHLRFPGFHLWRATALAIRAVSILFPGVIGRLPGMRHARGHTVVAVMRKPDPLVREAEKP
jgi:2-polyprenyl-3-methyl-5-hydroxy-6-metoxy-1,4-benzoquinol methylase